MKPGDIVYSVVPVMCFTSLTGIRLGFVGAEIFVGVIVDFVKEDEEWFIIEAASYDQFASACKVLTCINGENQYIYVFKSQLRRTPPTAFLKEEAKRRANLQ